jgi:hypothetical protein
MSIIYAIATKERKCYGHGEYVDELSIRQYNAYGPRSAFFHPVFLSKEKAKAYCASLGLTCENSVITLELNADTTTTETNLAQTAECEFARSGGWMG